MADARRKGGQNEPFVDDETSSLVNDGVLLEKERRMEMSQGFRRREETERTFSVQSSSTLEAGSSPAF